MQVAKLQSTKLLYKSLYAQVITAIVDRRDPRTLLAADGRAEPLEGPQSRCKSFHAAHPNSRA